MGPSKFTLSEGLRDYVVGKMIYLDNDFLSELFFEKDLLKEFINLTFDKAALIIDPLTEFEFLRSAFMEQSKRHDFISHKIFIPALNHQEIFKKIQDNALLLSMIYAHNGRSKGVSFVDLFLAGRVMINPLERTRIITGNKKDFPSCVFDTEGVLTKINHDDSIKSYALLKFSKDNYLDAERKLHKVI